MRYLTVLLCVIILHACTNEKVVVDPYQLHDVETSEISEDENSDALIAEQEELLDQLLNSDFNTHINEIKSASSEPFDIRVQRKVLNSRNVIYIHYSRKGLDKYKFLTANKQEKLFIDSMQIVLLNQDTHQMTQKSFTLGKQRQVVLNTMYSEDGFNHIKAYVVLMIKDLLPKHRTSQKIRMRIKNGIMIRDTILAKRIMI